jgi:hypothetical protein
VLAKDYSTKRASVLAAPVSDWSLDPRDPECQVGLVPVPAQDDHADQYQRMVTRVAVRLANAWPLGSGASAG